MSPKVLAIASVLRKSRSVFTGLQTKTVPNQTKHIFQRQHLFQQQQHLKMISHITRRENDITTRLMFHTTSNKRLIQKLLSILERSIKVVKPVFLKQNHFYRKI